MLENSIYTIELDTIIKFITDGSYSGMKLTPNGRGIAIEVDTTPFIQQRIKKMLAGEGVTKETLNSLVGYKTFMNYDMIARDMSFTTLAKTKAKEGEIPTGIRVVYKINEKSEKKALENLEKLCQSREGVSLEDMYHFLAIKEDSVLYKVVIASIREVICQYWDGDKTYIEVPDVATIQDIIADIESDDDKMDYIRSIQSLVDKDGEPIRAEWNALFDHTIKIFSKYIDETYIELEEKED